MDMIQSTLLKYYKYNSWSCGDTYESLDWNDIITPQPSKNIYKIYGLIYQKK